MTFERLKQMMLARIERNSIKINVDGEVIYLKKSGYPKEWHVIYPPVNLASIEQATDEKGTIDWKKVTWDKINLFFGGKANAIKTFAIGIIVVLFALGIYEVISSYNEFISNPAIKACLEITNINFFG